MLGSRTPLKILAYFGPPWTLRSGIVLHRAHKSSTSLCCSRPSARRARPRQLLRAVGTRLGRAPLLHAPVLTTASWHHQRAAVWGLPGRANASSPAGLGGPLAPA